MPATVRPPAQRVRPATTVSWILDNLRAAILDGSLKAHALVRQDELAAAYGVSRMPIREAIRLLEAEGLVIPRPNRSVLVAPLDPDDAEQIFDVRAVLESLALLRSIPRLDEEQKNQATAALEMLEQAESAESSAAHRAFHLSLHAAAGGRLIRLIGQHIDAADRYLRLEATLAGTLDKDRHEHRAILNAAIAGDVETARRLMKEHVTDTGREIAVLLRERSSAHRPAESIR
jgi:DNA-binding GntR family transcriptional regulator